MVAAASGLFASLFLTWSHQYPASLLEIPGMRAALAGVPRDADAWQVYSAADVLLATLSVALVIATVAGLGRGRWLVFAASLIALAFVMHALSVPPTDGVDVTIPGRVGVRFARSLARDGPGETMAAAALALAVAGSAASLGARRR